MLYKIIDTSTGEIIGMTATVNYIRKKPETGVLVTAKKIQDATGIAYKSIPYNLSGTVGIDADITVIISEFDEAEFMQELKSSAEMLEDAMCEQDAINEERFGTIEDALCEMDMEEEV